MYFLLIYLLEAGSINVIDYDLAPTVAQLLECLRCIFLYDGYYLSQLLLSYLFYSLVESVLLTHGDLLGLLFRHRLFDWDGPWL